MAALATVIDPELGADIVSLGMVPSVDITPDGRVVGGYIYDTVDPEVYVAPFTFTGGLEVVRLDVSGELLVDEAAEFRRMMAQQ
mgnify:CR=1 FL=1